MVCHADSKEGALPHMEKEILLKIVLLCVTLLSVQGIPYRSHIEHGNKTCADIRCLRSEVCILQRHCDLHSPCTTYPICKSTIQDSCERYQCPPGQYCTMVAERCYHPPCHQKPTCVVGRVQNSCYKYTCPPGQYCTMIPEKCFHRPCKENPTCVSGNLTRH